MTGPVYKTTEAHRARSRAYYWANRGRVLAREKVRRGSNRDAINVAQRMRQHERNFGGLRDAALERDGYACVLCGTKEQLVVHHLDGNGRGSQSVQNTLENLQTLCRACHQRVHKPRKGTGRPNRIISCACGCGTMFWEYSKASYKRKYVSGHQPSAFKGRRHTAASKAKISASKRAARCSTTQ